MAAPEEWMRLSRPRKLESAKKRVKAVQNRARKQTQEKLNAAIRPKLNKKYLRLTSRSIVWPFPLVRATGRPIPSQFSKISRFVSRSLGYVLTKMQGLPYIVCSWKWRITRNDDLKVRNASANQSKSSFSHLNTLTARTPDYIWIGWRHSSCITYMS